MKKCIAAGLLLLLFAACASAEIVGTTPQFDNIHRYIAPNGQEIYYVSREDKYALVKEEDVNFDGHDDLVMLITQGASNAFYEFYVWNDGQYALAGRNALLDWGLGNYTLDAQNGYVISHYTNGWAGMLHEEHIFRWKGNDLELVRYAISEHKKTELMEGDVFVTIENCDLLHVRVFDCRYGEYERTDDVIFEEVASVSEGFDELVLLDREREALWQGLK